MKIEISESISEIRLTKFNVFIFLYLFLYFLIILFIIKNVILSFLSLFLIIMYIIYRKIFIKNIKNKIKIFMTDLGIEMTSPKIKKISYSNIKNIAYIQNNSYGEGDIIINISPLKVENKYIDLFFKNDYTFAESINYKTFIIPDVKNVEKIFKEITEKKKIEGEILIKKIEDREKRIEIYSSKVIKMFSKINNTGIIFYDDAEYNEIKKRIEIKRMGITDRYLKELKLPSLKLS